VRPFRFDEPIATERLLLRPPTVADADAVLAYQGREDVCRYQEYGPRDRADVEAWAVGNGAAVRLESDGDHLQPVLERSADGRVVGDLYLALRSVRNATAAIGWTVHPDFQGSGYATEGARALLEIVFGRMGLHRVVAELDPRNTASVAVCRRLGMREEARFVQDLWFKGGWGDTGVHAMLEKEWAGGAPRSGR
jgi:RimJ/RimL family protein N-acetyltransferase